MKLSIGVIVVGSLDWESKDHGPPFRWKLEPGDAERIEHRTRWRNNRLAKNTEYRVRVPIRYGRKSGKRENTFTIVFSPEFGNRLGTAKAIRCKRDVTSIADLTAEAVCRNLRRRTNLVSTLSLFGHGYRPRSLSRSDARARITAK
jgi:hypothetical protein